MPNQSFNNFDLVSVNGREGVWTVVGDRGSLYYVQLGADVGSRELLKSEQLTLIQKTTNPDDDGPRLIPMRGVME